MLRYFSGFGAFSQPKPAILAEPFQELPSQLYREGPLLLTPQATRASTSLEEVSRISSWSVRAQAISDTLERTTVKMVAEIPNTTSVQVVEIAEDICRCARTLLHYYQGSQLTINLQSIFPRHDAAALRYPLAGFHLDRSPCRLIRTYVGPGTEWLEPQRVITEKFNAYFKSGIEQDFANTSDIRQIPEGAIAIFHGPSFIHRRPSFAGPRVFLSIDLR